MVVKKRTNVYECHYHLVCVTKYRKVIFETEEQRYRMRKILEEIAQEHEFLLEKAEICPEHIHLMISFAPTYSGSDIVKKIKGISARRWFLAYPETKKLLWGGHLWSPSYYLGTLGNVSKSTVMAYIENQLREYNNGRPRRDSSRQ